MSEQAGYTSRAGTARGLLQPLGAFCGKVAGKLADFVLPPLCLGCRSSVQGHDGLCADCWPGIDFIEPPRCDVLGIPLPFPSGETVVSAAALANPPEYERARAVARYDGVELFCRWLSHAGADVLEDADMLVPVPLARTRLWSRRFNQSALLARMLAHAGNIPDNPFAVKRIRPTASQVGLSAEQRKANVAGAFRVPEHQGAAIAGRNILLIDDVITTGATANACAKALKRAGAERVDVLALARVVDPLTPRL